MAYDGRQSAVPGRLTLVIVLAVLAMHASLLASWIVDDAGITFAYARNLASGHGLVAQPGQAAVEGFSNPLWTMVIAGLFAAGLFDLTVVPKALGLALAAGVIVLMWDDLRRRTPSQAAVAVPLLCVASCSSFVIWTTSGLENALLAFLVMASVRLALTATEPGELRPATDVAAGVLAALIALTRPDALAYAAMYPLAAWLSAARRGWWNSLDVWRRWLRFGVGLAPVFGAYLLFRVRYFGEVVPNTFYAKAKPSLAAASAGKLADLFESASGDWFPLVVLFLIAGPILLLRLGRLSARTIVLIAYVATATAVFLVMPPDWMGEYRFASVFYPLLFWLLADVAVALGAVAAPAWTARACQAAVVAFTIQLLTISSARTLTFAAHPTVPLAEVQAYAGQGFNHLADVLGADDMSILTPDLGGALLDSTMRVYDLAGLCDRRIARALSANNTADIQNYVFDDIRPTFIHTHGAFTRASRLSEDPRFGRDYVAIYEHDTGPQQWNALWVDGAAPAWAGDYVRRDALGTNQERLDALKRAYDEHGLTKFVPWVRPPDRLRRGWPQLAWAAETLASGPGLDLQPEAAPR